MSTEDLSTWYDVANGDAELVTIEGVPDIPAIFDISSQVVLGDAVVTAPTLRVPATVAAGDDGPAIVRGTTYVIRQRLDLPPDGRERLLVLAKVTTL